MHLLIALTYMRHRSLCYLEPKRSMDEWKSPDRSSPCFCDKLSTPSMVATVVTVYVGHRQCDKCSTQLYSVLEEGPHSKPLLTHSALSPFLHLYLEVLFCHPGA